MRTFEGLKVDANFGFGDTISGFQQWDGSITAGHSWNGGNAYISFSYAHRDAILNREASWVTGELFDAGHILGSAGLLIRAEGKRLFYTGDVNFEDQTLMRAARFPEDNIDVLVMETTRGDSPVPEGFTRKSEEERFLVALQSALDEDAPVLIPVFALGKTQELLALLHEARKSGALRGGFGLYVGGLGAKITAVTDRLRGRAPRRHGDLKLATCMPMEVVGGRDMAHLPVVPRTVYAISSGMMTENTLSNMIAPRVLENPRAHCMFVGYSDPESPAGKLRGTATRPARLAANSAMPPPDDGGRRRPIRGWPCQAPRSRRASSTAAATTDSRDSQAPGRSVMLRRQGRRRACRSS
ncbi:MAG: hypothetical protein ACO3XN_10280, partial [Chthoniobacterales bacterium]